MNKIEPRPILPQEINSPSFQALMGRIATALNQAADGQLWLSKAITTTYTAGENDHVILCSPSAPFTLTLPNVALMVNKIIHVKRANNTTHTITVGTVAGLIDGAATVTLTTAYQSRSFYSDGTSYHLIT